MTARSVVTRQTRNFVGVNTFTGRRSRGIAKGPPVPWEPALQASVAMSRERSRHPSAALAWKAKANVRRQGMGGPELPRRSS